MRRVRRGAPARGQVAHARPGEDGAQDRGARSRLHPERLGEGAAGPYDLVVEEGGVEALAADLGGLFEDAVVGGVPGEGGGRAALPGALREALGADGRGLQTNRYFGQSLTREPAGGRPGAAPGEGGEGGVDGTAHTRGDGRARGVVHDGEGRGP